MTTTQVPKSGAGIALVAVQFLLLGVLGLAAGVAAVTGGVPTAAWLLGTGGVGLGWWAVACNRPGNFNIRPEPRAGGHLVSHGPYRWIRHPMYTAVIAIAAACAVTIGALWGWLCVVALGAVLAAKAHLEERALLAAHPGYVDYRARTRRFLPWVL